MKIVAITQARFGSSRFPGKVLKKINGETLLSIHLKRVLQSRLIDKLIVATTHEPEAQEICAIATACNVSFYKGSLEDVLDRYYQAAKNEGAGYIVRITSDCPLIDAKLIDAVIDKTVSENADYGSNGFLTLFPDGQDIEVFKFSALEKAWKNATILSEREHVTPYIWKNSSLEGGHMFISSNLDCEMNYSSVRMTVDEEADFGVIKSLIDKLGINAGWREYADFYMNNEDVKNQNSFITRNEGYIKSIEKDDKQK